MAKALRQKFSGINTASEYVVAPPTFPHTSILEADNSFYERTADSSGQENHSAVMYVVNIYSNKKTGKKSECKAIAAEADKAFNSMGFTRTTLTTVENADPSICRMTGRYKAIASANKEIYRR